MTDREKTEKEAGRQSAAGPDPGTYLVPSANFRKCSADAGGQRPRLSVYMQETEPQVTQPLVELNAIAR